jgi:peptide chain release factor 3
VDPSALTATAAATAELTREVARRRTFAIISHPDAGKTTLTEKTLLYAGAIELAGAVRGRKSQRAVVSDWMEIERDRGISITSAALEFDLWNHRVVLLDTPGHKDFSEDTYRTLLAVDSVVMVLDAAKGIETQTRKLFEVCRQQHLPILTFINKCDLPGQDPLDLLDEIERELGLAAVPMNWPIGTGQQFRGIYDIGKHEVLLYERVVRGERRAPVEVAAPSDPALGALIGEREQAHLLEAIELLTGAGVHFDLDDYRAAKQTPVFFGSALANFGLEPFLQALVAMAPPPQPRPAVDRVVDPASIDFSGFVFKIQANMNPKHRDRIAFLRVCSGVLTRDMTVQHARLGSTVRLASPQRFFGRERETVDTAYPGDVVGLVNPGRFLIGDTVYSGERVEFPPIAHFPAEHFAVLRLRDTRYKQFDDGLRQLEEEGLMQVLFPATGAREPILGVVGELQFDVIVTRLKNEYNVTCEVARTNYVAARWVVADDAVRAKMNVPLQGVMAATDRHERPVLLFASEWDLDYTQRQNPDVVLAARPQM